ncbi:hypothetical protein F3J40_03110 [Pantoea sp. Acro-835]|uniref:Uncharacterized protein n=2 Tax=Candidatus Pantoea multigeneris TaxID=2608357 RepID=A0ABX0R830_9GAMM|nr:hypothetical protein [Pantoea multigeneris]
MTKEFLIQIINEAQQRARQESLPLDARVNSRVTVNDCIVRADKEGWDIYETREGVWKLREQDGKLKKGVA